jgi:hypothetical protein
MKISHSLAGVALLAATLAPCTAGAQAVVGSPAPQFTATDSRGQAHTLDQYHGKYVVLEWHNQGCLYTQKHYVSGNMQALQKEWTAKGVVWFTVISSAPGKQGYVTDAEEHAYLAEMHADPTAVLMDRRLAFWDSKRDSSQTRSPISSGISVMPQLPRSRKVARVRLLSAMSFFARSDIARCSLVRSLRSLMKLWVPGNA